MHHLTLRSVYRDCVTHPFSSQKVSPPISVCQQASACHWHSSGSLKILLDLNYMHVLCVLGECWSVRNLSNKNHPDFQKGEPMLAALHSLALWSAWPLSNLRCSLKLLFSHIFPPRKHFSLSTVISLPSLLHYFLLLHPNDAIWKMELHFLHLKDFILLAKSSSCPLFSSMIPSFLACFQAIFHFYLYPGFNTVANSRIHMLCTFCSRHKSFLL